MSKRLKAIAMSEQSTSDGCVAEAPVSRMHYGADEMKKSSVFYLFNLDQIIY